MTEKINTGTVLIGEGGFLPESPWFESESFWNGWKLAQDFDGYRLDRRIHQTGRSFLKIAVRQRALWLLFLFLFAAASAASAQGKSPAPTVDTLIARMAQARDENQARFRSYIVTRDYQLFGKERDKNKSQVIADVTFVPPDSKKYAIQQSMGSGLGEKVVRRMLAREADITKDCRSTDFSLDNYDFRYVREADVEGQRCYVLELLPKRKDRNLVRGNIWVDANTYLLRRTEGEPAKSLSWWLRDVRLVFDYGEVGGMWLQTALEATADVRILGQYTVVSRDVKYQLSELVAAGPSTRTRLLEHRPSGSRHHLVTQVQ
jgi:outer membrane lipoprotein-sorting protein